MVKIIYRHSAKIFQNLKIAGDFTDWKAIPMVKNSGDKDDDGSWEVIVDVAELPKSTKKIHFKFIDDNGTWFTDDNYAKEIDGNSNENNVQLLSEEECSSLVTEESDKQQTSKFTDDGPQSPAPSLKDSSSTVPEKEIFSENAVREQVTAPSDDQDEESVGEPPIVVNHSDAEETENLASNEEVPHSSGTVFSNKGQNPEQYKNILARIIAFFTNLFHSWFS